MNNTNNNSISSIKASKNFYATSKNNLFNKKIPTFKPKTSLKHYAIGEKMYLYKKKNESQQHMNSLGMYFPIDLLKNNKYSKFINNVKSNNYVKYNGNNNMNKNNSINNKSSQFNKNKANANCIHSNLNINKSNILNNNSKMSNTKKNNNNISNNSNITYLNNSLSPNYNNKNNKNKASNPINTYIINTLNVSEKDFLREGISTQKQQKSAQKANKIYEEELNKLIKEKEESENIIKKQEKLIDKLVEDNQKLDNRIKEMQYENKKISKKIEIHQENQEQLILLVKIIQKSGVDVEDLIDKWNNNVEMENYNLTNTSNNNESYTDSMNELNGKIDPSSFIPINIEEPQINKKVFNGIPKLNFDIIKNGREGNKRPKFRNNSK